MRRLASVALLLVAGCGKDQPCAAPLPCAAGDPPARYATCGLIVCTPIECDGCTSVRCWQGTAYRTATPEGSMWSDGARFAACDRDGALRASGRVDGAGIPICADRCDPGHCPAPRGANIPACAEVP